MTQEFHVSVTSIGNDEYLVRTEKVASGVPLAEEQVRWPVSAWLTSTGQLMSDPLLGILAGQPVAPLSRNTPSQSDLSLFPLPQQPSLNLVDLGQRLYNGLFQGTMRDSWTCAQAIAQNRRELLQLRLGIKGKQLSSLPWEVLHAGDRPLATGTDVVFSRYQLGTGSILHTHVLPPNQPLRILIAIATPSDQERLELKREVLHLQEELQSDGKRGALHPFERGNGDPAIQLTILEQPDREQLTQTLEQGKYQVFHYAGHSNLSTSGGELYLVNRRTGLTETLSGDDLAGLLVNNGVQLAVLNSCRGAYGNPVQPLGEEDSAALNLAETLVRRGIPGVLAMAERIPDEVALTLTRLLYRNLNQGHPVDLSLSRARQGLISAYGSHQLYWALPILYLHREFDGYLTTRQTGQNLAKSPEPVSLDHALPSEFDFAFAPVSKGSQAFEEWDEDDSVDTIEQFSDEDYDSYKNGETPADLNFIGSELRKLQTNAPYSARPELAQKPLAALPPRRNQPVLSPGSTQRPRLRQWLPLTLLSIPIALGIWGVQWGWQRANTTQNLPPTLNASTPGEQATNLEAARTDYVLGIAVEQFHQGNLAAGAEATAELLDRGALSAAKAALGAVPSPDNDTAQLNFLQGRLAWQSIQQGSPEYTLDDARRFWARAVQQDPKSLEYRNALGFAYYSEGNLEQAYQTWITIVDQEKAILAQNKVNGSTEVTAEALNVKQQLLTTYAGLGLALMKSAANLPPEEQAIRYDKAAKFCDKVLLEGQDVFKAPALARHWLWSSELIRDWQMLLRLSKVEVEPESSTDELPNPQP
ncbi:MAG: CHAT domain-containing protein [Microcoleaceae cyanobacterium]